MSILERCVYSATNEGKACEYWVKKGFFLRKGTYQDVFAILPSNGDVVSQDKISVLGFDDSLEQMLPLGIVADDKFVRHFYPGDFKEVLQDLKSCSGNSFSLHKISVDETTLFGLRSQNGFSCSSCLGRRFFVTDSLIDPNIMKAAMYAVDKEAYKSGEAKFVVVARYASKAAADVLASRNSVGGIIVGKIVN